jgi:aminoglycoside phosphotransferase (APT) family kinase protein
VTTGAIDEPLLDELITLGRAAAGGGDHAAIVLKRSDTLVVAVGPVVVKAHPADAREAELCARLRLVESEIMSQIWLAPVRRESGLLERVRERLVTIWPRGTTVCPDDPDAAPWEQAASLLARLHGTPVAALGGPARELPEAGGPRRVARAVARLQAERDRHDADRAVVLEAVATLPPWVLGHAQRPRLPESLVHGDWHLGQLVRCEGEPKPDSRSAPDWRLIDIDDLGVGDPAWDLARPAALYASGLLEPALWQRLLASYRGHGGFAVPTTGDPWPALDIPARALAVQAGALAWLAARREVRSLTDEEAALIEACRRIARTGTTA